jgi:hypothetical protein
MLIPFNLNDIVIYAQPDMLWLTAWTVSVKRRQTSIWNLLLTNLTVYGDGCNVCVCEIGGLAHKPC